jgi:hypothetical protein
VGECAAGGHLSLNECYRFEESVTDLEAFNADTGYQADSMGLAANPIDEDWLI